MRRTIVVGLTIATLLLLGQALVAGFGIGGNVYAASINLSDLGEAALQATRTATPGTLPETGGEGNLSLLILGAGALVMLGAAVLVLVSSRRGDSSEI